MRYMLLVALVTAACDSSGPLDNHSVPNGFGGPGIEDPEHASSTYPYEGADAAFVVVTATLDGQPIDCLRPVLYDIEMIEVDERCGEPVPLAPGVALMVTVGDTDDPCDDCYTTNQYGGGWQTLPLTALEDGGKAVGVPTLVEPKAGETIEVVIELNQYAHGRWFCEFSPIDYEQTDDIRFQGTGLVLMPWLGELTTNGRQVEAVSGYDLSGQGAYLGSFALHFEGYSISMESNIVADCIADE